MSTVAMIDYTGLDNTIKTGIGGPDYTANNGVIEVDYFSTGNQVNFKTNGYTFGWTPQNMKYVDENGTEDTIYTVQDVPIEVKANYARFNRPMTDVDDWFIVEGDKLKHQILVQGFQRDPVPFLSGEIDFVFGGQVNYDASLSIMIDGVPGKITGPFGTEGGIDFVDENGALIYTLPPIVAYDSGIPNRASTTGKYKVTQNDAGVLAFDIVIDNAWFADTDRVYPIVIDPTVVANSAYDLFGNGTHKLGALSNGWLLAAVNSTSSSPGTLYMYISKDNGNSWQQLCSISANYSSADTILVPALSGTLFYVFYSCSTANTGYYCVPIDAATATNTDYSSQRKLVIAYNASPFQFAATTSGYNPSATIDNTGKLYLVYINNNFDLCLRTSTDGGSTWSAETRIAVGYNGSNSWRNLDTSCAFLNGNLVVIASFNTQATGAKTIVYGYYLSGGTWTRVTVAGTGSTYNFYYPFLVADKSGVLHAFYYGEGNGFNGLGHSKSTDGGQTWSATEWVAQSNGTGSTLASSCYYPVASIDPNKGDLYLFFSAIYNSVSTSYRNIVKAVLSASAGTWTVSALTNNTTNNAANPHTVATGGAINYMYQDAQAGAIQAGSISIDTPPNAPTLTQKSGFDATKQTEFDWTFSDPNAGDTQSAFQLQILEVDNGTTVLDTGKVASTSSSYTLAAGTLTNGKQYQWRVTTWDSSSVQGPWSAYGTFTPASPPTVTITVPTANQVVTGTSLTATWSFSDPGSYQQASYDVKLCDSTGNAVLWDSGTVNSAGNAQTIGYTLQTGLTYVLKVTATNSQGISSAVVSQTFSTNFTPPSTPTVTATSNTTTASNTINWANPSGPVAVAFNRLYKQVSGSWVLYQDNLTGTTYTDYLVGSGVSTTYGVSAIGTNGVESAIASITQTVTFTGDWLYDSSTGSQFQFLYNRTAYSMETLEERKEYQTFGSKPMIRRGPLNARKGTLDALMVNGSQTPMQQLQALESSMANHPVYYLKTAAGEVLKVDVHTAKRNMPVEYLNKQAIGISVDWTEVA